MSRSKLNLIYIILFLMTAPSLVSTSYAVETVPHGPGTLNIGVGNCYISITRKPNGTVVVAISPPKGPKRTIVVPHEPRCGAQLKGLTPTQLASVRSQLSELWTKKTDESEPAIRDAFTALNKVESSNFQSAELTSGSISRARN